jgi:hypothetical protein
MNRDSGSVQRDMTSDTWYECNRDQRDQAVEWRFCRPTIGAIGDGPSPAATHAPLNASLVERLRKW